MQDTKFLEIERLLAAITTKLKDFFGKDLVAIYLYGSLVGGDFNYNTSDIDIFVVIEEDVSQDNFNNLDDIHKQLIEQFPNWDDRLEIAYVSLSSLANLKTENYNIAIISPGESFNIKEAGIDWLINYYLLQNNSTVLFGKEVAKVVPFISKEEFIVNVKHQAINWLKWIENTKNSIGYQYYAVLTLCRAYYVVVNGNQVSKQVAGNWAKAKLAKWAELINRALAYHRAPNSYPINDNYELVYLFTQDIVNLINGDKIEMRSCVTSIEWDTVRKLRNKYFFAPNNIKDPYTWTFNHKDHKHFILYKGVNIIGYAHVQLWSEYRAAIRIIVIDEAYQGNHSGAEFMLLLEKWLRQQGYKSVHIESSPKALGFYKRLNYIDMPFADPDGYESSSEDIAIGKIL